MPSDLIGGFGRFSARKMLKNEEIEPCTHKIPCLPFHSMPASQGV